MIVTQKDILNNVDVSDYFISCALTPCYKERFTNIRYYDTEKIEEQVMAHSERGISNKGTSNAMKSHIIECRDKLIEYAKSFNTICIPQS
jgi:hypothetical protein